VNQVVYVASLQARVEARPMRVCAIPSTGFAACALDAESFVGGVAHLPRRNGPASGSWSGSWEAAVERLIARFMDDLAARCRLARLDVHIVGGADPIGILPRHVADEQAEEQAACIAACFEARGVAAPRVDVGGRDSRSVSVDLEQARVDIARVSRRATAQEMPTTDPPASSNVTVGIGDMAVSRAPGRLVTILGSCVGIALYSRSTRVGGLAHVALPHAPDVSDQPSRYADTAVPALLDAMARAGARRDDIVAKIAGGATLMIDRTHPIGTFAERNVLVARDALESARIPLVSEDVGGQTGRKMTIDLDSFQAQVQTLAPIRRP